MDPNDKIPISPLSGCLSMLAQKGFVHPFILDERGLKWTGGDHYYQPEDVQIIYFYRFKAESPDTQDILLYAIRANDGTMGTISDAYSDCQDSTFARFIRRIEEIRQGLTEPRPPERAQWDPDTW